MKTDAKNWEDDGGHLYYKFTNKTYPKLENVVYAFQRDRNGDYYLEKLEDSFSFDYKLYGLETELINRIIKTYNKKAGNLGALLNGEKGTGKSVTAKILCNKLQQPTILVTEYIYNDGIILLSSIAQNLTIFVDEYEKIYADKSELLSIMDGALNSNNRRMFILTTNTLTVNENLMDRPSRIRYLKTFGNLTKEVLEEIVDDRLINQTMKEDTIKFLSSLKTITIDSVNSVIDEINIHEELPIEFENIFNVTKHSDGTCALSNPVGSVAVNIHSVAERARENISGLNAGTSIIDKFISKSKKMVNI